MLNDLTEAAEFRDSAARLLAGCALNPATGCLDWTKGRYNNRYGRTKWRRRPWATHRLIWRLLRGPIPAGAFVCHRCDNPPCCNIEHLFLGDAKANAQDRERKRRGAHSSKSACRDGHPFDEANTWIRGNGTRNCRKCRAIALARFRAAHPNYHRRYLAKAAERRRAANAKVGLLVAGVKCESGFDLGVSG